MNAMRARNGLPPVHPGEIIKNDILPEIGLSVTAAAKALDVSRQMLHDILAERKPLSAIMCWKCAGIFGGSPEFWMRLQGSYDLKKAERHFKPSLEKWWRAARSKSFGVSSEASSIVFREVGAEKRDVAPTPPRKAQKGRSTARRGR